MGGAPRTGQTAGVDMSPDTAFAAAVAQFGMLLRDSPYAGTADWAGVARQLAELPSVEEDPYRDEFAYLVRRQAG